MTSQSLKTSKFPHEKVFKDQKWFETLAHITWHSIFYALRDVGVRKGKNGLPFSKYRNNKQLIHKTLMTHVFHNSSFIIHSHMCFTTHSKYIHTCASQILIHKSSVPAYDVVHFQGLLALVIITWRGHVTLQYIQVVRPMIASNQCN